MDLREDRKVTQGHPERRCRSCERALDMETNLCPYCGHWVRRSMFGDYVEAVVLVVLIVSTVMSRRKA